MRYEFHDPSYKHPVASWKEVFNVVIVYDSSGSCGGPYLVYKVRCFRLWNIELARIAIIYDEDGNEY